MKDFLNKDYDINKIRNIMLMLLIVAIIGGVILAEYIRKDAEKMKSLNVTTNEHCFVPDYTE